VRRLLPLAAALLLSSACTAEAKSTDTAAPFAGCAALTREAAAAPNGLPDLKLPCFTGKEQVSLRSLGGPAVINIWASWCDPCRRELPVMQRLADTAGDKLTVLGVDTGDSREAGASFAADQGVKLPTLFDQDKKLVNAVGGINLPVTVFLDAAGKTYVNLLPLDAPKLAAMVKEHTGVVVTG
jgi:cytochrome c biogenesis protein CcmG/thiol:disulfide interchange protein DsbE